MKALSALLITFTLLGSASRARADLTCVAVNNPEAKLVLTSSVRAGQKVHVYQGQQAVTFNALNLGSTYGKLFQKTQYMLSKQSVTVGFLTVVSKVNMGRGGNCGRAGCNQFGGFDTTTATLVLNEYTTQFNCN